MATYFVVYQYGGQDESGIGHIVTNLKEKITDQATFLKMVEKVKKLYLDLNYQKELKIIILNFKLLSEKE